MARRGEYMLLNGWRHVEDEMGLNVSVSLVVGVPLTSLGEVVEEVKTYDVTNRIGRKTGRTAKVKSIYLKTKNDCIKIGSNESDVVGTGWRVGMDWFFYNIVGEENDHLIHLSDWSRGPSNAVIGLQVGDSSESLISLEIQDIRDVFDEVREYLIAKFGYTGNIYVNAICNYSY